MNNSSFTIGDVVLLKSGGPRMTVTAINDNTTLSCIWFEGNKKMEEIFPLGVLNLYTPPDLSFLTKGRSNNRMF